MKKNFDAQHLKTPAVEIKVNLNCHSILYLLKKKYTNLFIHLPVTFFSLSANHTHFIET